MRVVKIYHKEDPTNFQVRLSSQPLLQIKKSLIKQLNHNKYGYDPMVKLLKTKYRNSTIEDIEVLELSKFVSDTEHNNFVHLFKFTERLKPTLNGMTQYTDTRVSS